MREVRNNQIMRMIAWGERALGAAEGASNMVMNLSGNKTHA